MINFDQLGKELISKKNFDVIEFIWIWYKYQSKEAEIDIMKDDESVVMSIRIVLPFMLKENAEKIFFNILNNVEDVGFFDKIQQFFILFRFYNKISNNEEILKYVDTFQDNNKVYEFIKILNDINEEDINGI